MIGIKLIDQNLQAIIKILKQHQAVFAYIFGSQVNGATNRLSDFDIAVYLSKNISAKDYFDLRLKLMSKLEDILKKQMDIVILNEASPLITQMAIVKGRELFCRDEAAKINLIRQNLHKFDDALYLISVYNNYLNRRIFENKLGECL